MSMLGITLICPYFGTIDQNHHLLWLKGCEANPNFRFLLITNDESALAMEMPENVRGIYMTWEDCKALIQSRFDYEIKLDSAYKLCDYRPAYGEIFSDFLSNADFWGHTDSGDTLYGDLGKFLTDDLLEQFDKIHMFGHLTLYRNTAENNRRYTAETSTGTSAREVFTTSENLCFDDMYQKASINRIYSENGFSLLARVTDLVADLFPSRYAFQIVEDQGAKIPRVFEWDHGRLFDVTVQNHQMKKREIGYVHFQKRKMVNEVPTGTDHFYMIPNRFIPADQPLTCGKIEEWSKDRLYLDPMKGRIKRIVNYAKQPDVFVRKVREKLGK